MKRGIKERIIPIFRDRAKTIEAFADIGGSDQVIEASHLEGPSNAYYRQFMQMKQRPTVMYRENYEEIQWEGK